MLYESSLSFYKDDFRIGSIAGYTPQFKGLRNYKHDIYLTRKAESWGWATWLDRWHCCDWDVKDYNYFRNSKLKRYKFDKIQRRISNLLDNQQLGKNDSWAVRWVYYLYTKKQMTVYPKVSLVSNRGFDNSGRHCVETNVWDVELQRNVQISNFEKLTLNRKLERQTAKWDSTSLLKKIKCKIESVTRKIIKRK